MSTHDAVEQTARESYGRLLAYLAVSWRDMAAAEDALSDAFLAALENWPKIGVPENPEAWLLTTARRRMIDSARRSKVVAKAAPSLIAMAEEAQTREDGEMEFPDERLKLLFICAHPAIDAAIHTPLMLQTVLRLDAARIASAFLVRPSTMGQRLSRAKSKIRNARIAFELPEANDLPSRLSAVLEAIYAAYGLGWDNVTGADAGRKELADEAIYLGRLLSQLLPTEPEVKGLLALMLYCESRRDARRTPTGRYVPLSKQDVTLWSRSMIWEAEQCLILASQAGKIGRFQLEAAIQSAYAQRAWRGQTEWEAIALLYEGLVRIAPTIGSQVGRAAAISEAQNAEQGYALLENIPFEAVRNYQPYWALAAHLLQSMNRTEEARSAYSRAIGLCQDQAMREFLAQQASRI